VTGALVQSFLSKPSNASAIFVSKHVLVREIKKLLARVNVFGSNAPDEPVLARNSFVRGIPVSGSSGLEIFA